MFLCLILTSPVMAEAKGNAAFTAGNHTEAIKHFTDAINVDPTNHVLYSNRSGAYASLNQYSEALSDANKTVELKPDWSEGYSRRGAAYHGLCRYKDAISGYRKALEIDPNNETLRCRLVDSYSAYASCPISPPAPTNHSWATYGPDMLEKLLADPAKRRYIRQQLLKDQRLIQARKFPWNTELQSAVEDKWFLDSPEDQAEKEKEAGNSAYRKNAFATAIRHYSKALEFYDGDISVLSNRAAVYLEMRKYDECIKDCEKAVERGRELGSDSKMVAIALTRKGTALFKLAKTSKDYESAIQTFQKALTEYHNLNTLKKLNEAERAKKELEQQEFCPI